MLLTTWLRYNIGTRKAALTCQPTGSPTPASAAAPSAGPSSPTPSCSNSAAAATPSAAPAAILTAGGVGRYGPANVRLRTHDSAQYRSCAVRFRRERYGLSLSYRRDHSSCSSEIWIRVGKRVVYRKAASLGWSHGTGGEEGQAMARARGNVA